MKKILLIILLFCLGNIENISAQWHVPNIKGAIQTSPTYDTCYSTGLYEPSQILSQNKRIQKYKALDAKNKAAARSFQNSLATSQIDINFSAAFQANTAARAAFRFAADMWELELVSSVPIVIEADLSQLEPGVIGQNGSNRVRDVPNAPDPTVIYNSSLGNAIAGVDLLPGQPDLIQTYNSEFSFYYGTDARPGSLTDFVTIVFHEIGHGMGISGISNGGQGVGDGFGENPGAWDTFVEPGDGTPILDLGFGTEEQQQALVSNDLFIDSYNSTKALNGTRPKIYAPATYNEGSSYSHWDESTFPRGDPNSLMTPFNSAGEAIHDLGGITRGILLDMGWELASQEDFDLGIATITSPTSGQDLSMEQVTVVIGNLGIEPVSNIPVSYRVDNGAVITEIFKETIEPNQERTFTFQTLADLSTPNKTYTITAFIDLTIDTNPDNDATFTKVTHLLPIAAFPYQESFENGSAGWTVEGTNLWELGKPMGTIINSASDGTMAWVTNLNGNYSDQTTSFLMSPVFNFTGKQDPTITLDIWYDIEYAWDGAALQYSTDNGGSWQTLGQLGDPNNWYTDGDARTAASDGSEGEKGIDALTAAVGDGDGWTGTGSNGSGRWLTASHLLTNLGGEANVMLRLVFASDQASNNEGFGMDNVNIMANDQQTNDVGVVSVNQPVSANLSSAETIAVTIKNFGLTDASGFEIAYTIDGGTAVKEVFNPTLAAGASTTFTFSQKADLSAIKVYQIKASTQLAGDEDITNDAAVVNVENIFTASSFPYVESFESGTSGWKTVGRNTSWQLGAPSNTIINRASVGTRAWVTGLTSGYNNNELSYLISPGFDFTGLTEPAIGLDIWFETEVLDDGILLQASTDNEVTWTTIGQLNDPVNWYNATRLATTEVDATGLGWNGSSMGYWTATHALGGLAGTSFVKLRFVFASDDQTVMEGAAIDNVRIFDRAAASFTVACEDPVVVSNDAGKAFATISIPLPTITGSGDSPEIKNDFTNTTSTTAQFPIGQTVVNFTVDINGQVVVCSTTVTVNDTEIPSLTCPADVVVAIQTGNQTQVFYEPPTVTDNFGFENQVTYSTDQTVDSQSSVACPTGPNAALRAFDLENDFDIITDFTIQSVDLGIQNAMDGPVTVEDNKVPVKVNLYLFDKSLYSVENPSDFIYANFTLVASADLNVEINTENKILNVPISATIPAGFVVVMEAFTEAGSDQIFFGANANQTGESYLFGPACGLTEPTAVSDPDLDFPEAQWVMNLNGISGTNATATLTSGLGSGGNFPLGTSTEVYTITDIADNSATCSFDVTVVQATLTAPVALEASNVQPTGFKANWQNVTGITNYQLFVSEDDFLTFAPGYNGAIIPNTSAVVTGLKANTAYYYKVRSVDSATPTAFSAFSNTILTSTSISAPLLEVPTNISDMGFPLIWKEVPNITDYEVDISTDNFATFVSGYEARLVSGNGLLVTDLTPNTTYQIRIRALNIGGESPNSNVRSAKTLPEQPRATTGTDVLETGFVAHWQSAIGATKYQVDISLDNFDTFIAGYQSLVVTGDTLLAVTGLNPNTTYHYRVRSVSSDGRLSANSNIIRVTTKAAVPVALPAEKMTTFGFTARWKPSGNVLSYELDLSTDNFSSFIFERKTVNETSIILADLSGNTEYQYRIRAVNRQGFVTDNSNTITVATPGNNGLNVPSTPVAEPATDIKDDAFTANWKEQNDAIYFEIDVSKDNFQTNLPAYDGKRVFGTSLRVTNLNSDFDYQYRVRAFNNEAFSELSNVIQVRTIVGLNPELEISDIKLFPNPAEHQVTLQLGKDFRDSSLRLIDLTGKLHLIKAIDFDGPSAEFSLSLNAIASGIYVLEISNKERREIRRLVIK